MESILGHLIIGQSRNPLFLLVSYNPVQPITYYFERRWIQPNSRHCFKRANKEELLNIAPQQPNSL